MYLVEGENGGMEVTARELLRVLSEVAPGLSYWAFINRELAAALRRGRVRFPEGIAPIEVPARGRFRPSWLFAEQTILPLLARRMGIRLLHSLGSTSPAWGPYARVVTIHDVIHARFPGAFRPLSRWALQGLLFTAAHRAQRVITVSNWSKRDIVEVLRVEPQKVEVVYPGAAPPRPADQQAIARIERLLDRRGRRLIFTPAADRPHKNLRRLVEALLVFNPESRPLLAITGATRTHGASLWRYVEQLGLQDDVKLLGWLSDVELEAVWSVADALVFPSLYEGFGLPVIEAMARSVPVACSRATALPEAAGEAALLFDGEEPREIAAAIDRILSDEALRKRLITVGQRRAAEFSWRRTAEQTVAVYARALGFSEPPAAWFSPTRAAAGGVR